jgi:CubicO group peptidase (beta-lactamase class C family)
LALAGGAGPVSRLLRMELRCHHLTSVVSVLAIVGSAFGRCQQTPAAAGTRSVAERLTQRLDTVVVGDARLAAAAVVDGKRLWSRARGRVDPSDGKAWITPQHLFDLGSVTKPITAAAVLRLQELGRLRLDDPIDKHLPRLESAAGCTILHLLQHTAGLPAACELSAAAQTDGPRAAA